MLRGPFLAIKNFLRERLSRVSRVGGADSKAFRSFVDLAWIIRVFERHRTIDSSISQLRVRLRTQETRNIERAFESAIVDQLSCWLMKTRRRRRRKSADYENSRKGVIAIASIVRRSCVFTCDLARADGRSWFSDEAPTPISHASHAYWL